MTSEQPYSELVTRHFDAPENVGPLCGEPRNVFSGACGQREHGARVRFEARIEAGRVVGIAFQAYGCPHVIAACSLVTQRLTGRPATDLERFDIEELARALGVPVEKTGRMLLVQDALHHCFQAWENTRLAGN